MAPFEMTKCNRCGSPMLMGLTVCPSCGQDQAKSGQLNAMQPKTIIAVALAMAVLIAFHWLRPAAQSGAATTMPSTTARPH